MAHDIEGAPVRSGSDGPVGDSARTRWGACHDCECSTCVSERAHEITDAQPQSWAAYFSDRRSRHRAKGGAATQSFIVLTILDRTTCQRRTRRRLHHLAADRLFAPSQRGCTGCSLPLRGGVDRRVVNLNLLGEYRGVHAVVPIDKHQVTAQIVHLVLNGTAGVAP